MDSGASPLLQRGGEPPEGLYQPTRFQRTLLLLRERLQDFDAQRAGDRLSSAVVRGAASGLALRGGLHAASYAFGLFLRRRRAAAAGARPGLAAVLEDTLRYAAFLGGFAGVFVAADEIIALLGGKKRWAARGCWELTWGLGAAACAACSAALLSPLHPRTSAWRALVAGAFAGPTILLTGSAETHTSLSLYVLLRGLALLVRCGNLPAAAPWKRRLLSPTRWRHGDVVLMCLSTAQIGYSWIILPSTLPPSYIRFLNRQGGKSLAVYDALREASARPPGAAPAALASLRGTRHAHFCGARPCGFLHPGRSCAAHVARFLPAAYLRAVPVYFPVYLIPAILVHRKRLVQRRGGAELWPKIGAGIARSSLFLSLFCTLAWGGACSGFSAAGRSSGRVIALSCWTGGLATLVEKKSRRMELAFYCMSRVRGKAPAGGGGDRWRASGRPAPESLPAPDSKACMEGPSLSAWVSDPPPLSLPPPPCRAGAGVVCAVPGGVGRGAQGPRAAADRRAPLQRRHRRDLPLLQRPHGGAAGRVSVKVPRGV